MGVSTTRTITRGSRHIFQRPLEAGQFIQVLVDQRGIDLALTSIQPQGSRLPPINSSEWGVEVFSLIPETGGPYKFEVSAEASDTSHGIYTIRIGELRSSRPDDRIRIQAQELFRQAQLEDDRDTADSQIKAIEMFGQAVKLWRTTRDLRQEARALTRASRTMHRTGHYLDALDASRSALQLFKRLGDNEE